MINELRYIPIASDEEASNKAAASARFGNCFRSIHTSLQKLREKNGGYHPEFFRSLRAAGDACFHNENYRDAVDYYDQAIAIMENKAKEPDLTPEEHFQRIEYLADIHVSIGLASQELKPDDAENVHFVKASKLYRDLLPLEKELSVKDGRIIIPLKLINTWNHIGNGHFTNGRYDLAMEKYRLALKDALLVAKALAENGTINRACQRTLRLYTANTLSNIGNVLGTKNESIEAMKYYNEALEIQTQVLGDVDPALVVTLHNIGTNYYHSGNFELALKSNKQVLKMSRNLLGIEHPNIADILATIAMILDKMGEINKSIDIYNEALRLAKKAHGQRNVKVADISYNLGERYAKSGNDETALIHFENAYSIYQCIYTTDNQHTIQKLRGRIATIKTKLYDLTYSWDAAVMELSKMFDFKNTYNPFTMLVEAFALEDDWVEGIIGCPSSIEAS